MSPPPDLIAWCRRHLGASPAAVVFDTGHLSRVLGLRMDDGAEIVVKIRPRSPRIAACTAVQRHLHERGFPCPAPLVGPHALGDQVATAERYVAPNGPPPVTIDPEPVARLLADLVDAAPPASAHAALDPAPPWVGWDHDGVALWPAPDDLAVDMNAHATATEVDDVARRIRARLRGDVASSESVVGHVDWEAHNLDWDRGRPAVVHDWDSIAIRPEVAVAGAAATVFSAHGDRVAASVEETAAFLEAYRSRRRHWTDDDVAVAWTAGLWVLAYNAKKETLGGGRGHLAHLDRELDARIRLARL